MKVDNSIKNLENLKIIVINGMKCQIILENVLVYKES